MIGIAGMFTACSDFDFEEHHMKEDPVKKAEYSANWSATFGKIDPKQDWNSVTQVTAYVDFSEYDNLDGCVLKVYTNDPYDANSRLLAKFDVTSPKMTITFDALKNSQFFYVVREKADGYYAAQIVDVKDGVCYANFNENSQSLTRGVAALTQVDFWTGSIPAYPEDVPADCYEITGNQDYVENTQDKKNLYIHSAHIGKTNLYQGSFNIYVSGIVVVDDWYLGANSNVYVLSGASLTIRKNGFAISLGQYNTTYFVCAESNLLFPDGVESAQGQVVYNAGTISSKKFVVSNNSLIVNQGTLNVTESLSVENEQSTLVNYRNIAASSMHVAGSGSFFSAGEIRISGNSLIDSNRATWYNNGHYYTGTMSVRASSDNWINNCYLKVNGLFEFWPQDSSCPFHNRSYIECDSYYQRNALMELSANAELRVLGTAKFQYNCYNEWCKQGIKSIATGSDWAVFAANKVIAEDPNQGYTISYIGQLIVDCNDHFPNGKSGDYPFIYIEGAAKFASSGDGYTIPSDDCREPYNPTKPDPTPEIPGSFIIACEDLGATNDIDFNDIVIRVSHVSGQTTAKVTPLAAGGTLKSNLLFKNRNLGEIHYLINGSTGESGEMEMLNTNYGGNNPGPGAPIEIEVAPDFTLSYDDVNMGGFSIVTYQKNSDSPINSVIIRAPEQGSAPQMILVPGNWQWPTERVQIYSAYPQFESWSQYGGLFTDWYNNPMTNASIMSL